MPKKLQPAELEKVLQPLPPAERASLMEQDLSADWLESRIVECKKRMRRDLWVGLPWFAAYTAALFTTGFGVLTICIFALGLIYFTQTIFTTGSFGLNRKRVKAFEELLVKMKNAT